MSQQTSPKCKWSFQWSGCTTADVDNLAKVVGDFKRYDIHYALRTTEVQPDTDRYDVVGIMYTEARNDKRKLIQFRPIPMLFPTECACVFQSLPLKPGQAFMEFSETGCEDGVRHNIPTDKLPPKMLAKAEADKHKPQQEKYLSQLCSLWSALQNHHDGWYWMNKWKLAELEKDIKSMLLNGGNPECQYSRPWDKLTHYQCRGICRHLNDWDVPEKIRLNWFQEGPIPATDEYRKVWKAVCEHYGRYGTDTETDVKRRRLLKSLLKPVGLFGREMEFGQLELYKLYVREGVATDAEKYIAEHGLLSGSDDEDEDEKE